MTNNRGGHRLNSGRKISPDKKKQVCLYVHQSIIDAHNGIDELKTKLYNFLKEGKK